MLSPHFYLCPSGSRLLSCPCSEIQQSLSAFSRVCCRRQEESALVGQRNRHPAGDLGRHAGKEAVLGHPVTSETSKRHSCVPRSGAAQHTAVPSQRSRFHRNIREAPRQRLLPHPRAVPLQDQTAEKQLPAVPREHQVCVCLPACVCE